MKSTIRHDSGSIPPLRHTPRVSLLRTALVAVLLALFGALSACGGGDEDAGSASVSIDSIEPERSYPGVETTVEFSIAPEEGVSESDLGWEVNFGDGSTRSGETTSGEVTYAWEESGQYTIEVRARAKGQTVGSATERIEILAPIDLAVSNVEPRPANVDAGGTTSAIFDVENNSASPVVTPFEINVFLTQETSHELDELSELRRVGSGTLEADGEAVVEAGSARTADIEVTIPDDTESGDYRLVPWIRPEGQFADENPEDNFTVGSQILRVSNISDQLPDLAVEEVFVVPDRAYPALNEFQRGFTLRNKGGAEAFEVQTETFLSVGDAEIDDDDIQVGDSDQTHDIPGNSSVDIGPDEFVLDSDITAEDGQKEVYVIVRASGSSGQDPDTANNIAVSDPPIVVSDELADGPDIVVESFSVSPEQTYIDGTLEVSMTIANRGNADVTSFPCRLYTGEEPRTNIDTDPTFSSVNITSLESGATKEIERSVTVSGVDISAGTYHIYTYCDPAGSLDETFRNNNTKVHPNPVEITEEPDLDMRIGSLDVPETTQEGDEVTITAEICVAGSNASGTSKGELYETTGTVVDFDAEPKTSFEIPNINPGECEDVDIPFEASCEDFQETYAYGIRIDVDDVVPENNEMNNRATAENDMEIEGEFCSCEEDPYEPNDTDDEPATPDDHSGLEFPGSNSASICTMGDCDYFGVDLQEEESLRVETRFLDEKGSLETTMYDPKGLTALDSDQTPDRQRVGVFNVPNADTYLFSICGATSSSQNLYDFDVEVLPQPQGVDLIPRKVELPSRETYSIGANVETNLRIHNIGDTASGEFDVEYVISPDRQIGDGNDVALSPGTVRADSVNASSQIDLTTEVELPTSLSSGTYYIAADVDPADEVDEADPLNNVSFSKEIELQTRCYDPLEPNDSFSEATSVSSQSYNNLTACASEDDYYQLCPSDGQKFEASTTYDPNEGDLDLELYDRNRKLIDSSATTGSGSETVSVDYVNGDQCYYIRPFLLTRQQQLEIDYDMSVLVEDVDPSLQCDSHFEPNDSISAASSLISALQTSESGTLDRCPESDTDYYYFNLAQSQTVSLRGTIDPASQPGTLRMQLYNPNEQPIENVETAPGVSEAEIKDFTAPTSGTYYLQITQTASDRRITYTLDSDGLGGVDLEASNLFFVDKTYSTGESFNLEFEITNLRSTTATDPNYTVFLGDGQSLDAANDTVLSTGSLGSDLAGNSTETEWTSVTIPQGASSGSKYIHVRVETDSSQTDPNTANNTTTKSISIQ